MQYSWLEKVSICTGAKEDESETYQCHPGHPPVLQNIQTELLDGAVDVEDSRSSL